jgi:curved DNA-binding protein CbpA
VTVPASNGPKPGAGLDPKEIKALARLVDDLDYYEILGAPRGSASPALRDAYHAASRKFHPDAHRHLDAELRGAVERIAKRVTEAYSVLRDPRRRKLYDERIAQGASGGARMQLVEGTVEAGRRAAEELGGKTPNGKRYFALAQTDLAKGDLSAAARNLQMACTFEPGNELFKRKLAEVKAKLR